MHQGKEVDFMPNILPVSDLRNYNEVLNWQYNFINENGYWMESNKHAQEWLCMIDGGNNNFI